MQSNDPRSQDRAQFEAICADLDEWEPLPEPGMVPVLDGPQDLEAEQESALDEQILAGLVMPV
jgi:hypothetical protein